MKADLDQAPVVDPIDPVPVDVGPVPDPTPITKDAREVTYLAEVSAVDVVKASSESTRLAAQKAVEATLQPGDRLETYDEAWKRLGLAGTPDVGRVVALGVVLERVPAKGGK